MKPGEWVWDVKILCADPTCEYHHPTEETAVADQIYDNDGIPHDSKAVIEVIVDTDGRIQHVLVDGTDMRYKIAADGLTIRPGATSNGNTLVDITLVAQSVTYLTE